MQLTQPASVSVAQLAFHAGLIKTVGHERARDVGVLSFRQRPAAVCGCPKPDKALAAAARFCRPPGAGSQGCLSARLGKAGSLTGEGKS